MRKIYLLLLGALFFTTSGIAQLTGTKNIPGDYPDLATAITDLNTQGVGAGGVTFNLLAGNPQSAPAGGYIVGNTGSALLTTSSAANPVTFQGNGNTITASAALTAGNLNDAILKLIGADWVTIKGFTLQENPANTTTTAASNNMTEWGIALLYASATDGAQNNTIQNNTISLNRTYANTFGIYSNVRHTATDVITAAEITSASGSNSGNKVYSNSISNANYAITFFGSGSTTAGLQDNGNDVGGSSVATANTITNSGGIGLAPSAYVGLAVTFNYLVEMYAQYNDNISYNSITSASGTTTSAVASYGGILKYGPATLPTGTVITNINNNTVTITNAPASGSTASSIGINSQSLNLSTATININNNNILNFAITGATATSNSISAITNLSACGTLNMNTNITRGHSSSATTGGFTALSNSGAVVNAININNNQVGNASGNAISFAAATTGLCNMIQNSGGAATCALSINGNSFKGLNFVTNGQTIAIFNTTGFVGNAVNITNNNIGTTDGNFVTFSGANSTLVRGIETDGASSTAAVAVTGNDFRGFVNSVAASTAFTFISTVTATPLSFNISNNTFTNLVLNTTGSVTFISNSGTLSSAGSKSINNNSIVTAFNKTGAGGTVTFYTTGSLSVNGSTSSATNNNFSNVTVTGATTISAWINAEGNTSTDAPAKTFTGNTFSNFTGGTSSITAVSFSFGGNNSNISNNTISNITGQGAISGIVLGSSNNGLAVSTNTITNLSSTGTGGTVTGISASSSGALGSVINQNSINNLSSSGASSSVLGISITGGTTHNIGNNTINTLSGTGITSPLARGISVSGGTTVNISKNKIYDLSETGAISTTASAVNGILLSGGTTVTAHNNIIGDLKAPAASLTDAIRGISITSTSTSSNYNIFFNTVYLNATSTGTNFGTSGIFHTYSATATTASMVLRNNVITNVSTPAGTGLTVALRRSASTDLNNFSTSSNNNLFYTSAAPDATHLIYYDGTNSEPTLPGYKTRVAPRDGNSISELPPFASTIGSSGTFLHMIAGSTTGIESGAVNLAGIPDDFDNDVRQGNAGYAGTGSAPDMGADEFEGRATGTPCTAPTDQATSLIMSAITATGATGNFTAAASTPTGYLVVRSVGALSGNPANGTSYSAGNTFANGTVIQSGATTTFTATGLTGNTNYTFTVIAYNSAACIGGPVYNNTAALTANATTCPGTPAALTTSNISTTTFQLNFTTSKGGGANPVTYNLEVTTDAAFAVPVAGSPFTFSDTTTNQNTMSYTVSGLSASTTYYFRLKANGCNTATATGSTATVCASTGIPYAENFDAVTTPNLPNCTSKEDVNNDANSWTTVTAPTGYTGKTLRYLYSTTNAANDWFYTQGLNLTGGTSYTLTFKYGNDGGTTYPEKLEVKYGTSPANGSMANALLNFPSITTAVNNGSTVFTPAVSGVYYIGFHAYSLADEDLLYLDDISVIVTPACPTPIGVAASGTTASSSNISWTCSGCAGPFLLEYGPANYTPGTGATAGAAGTLISPASSPQAISGLSSGTAYDVYVRQDCNTSSNGYSTNSTKYTFTTPAPAPANDNCAGAVLLTQTTYSSSCTGATYSTNGATTSPELSAACFSTSQDDDVWFKFVATDTKAILKISNYTVATGTPGPFDYALMSGTCGSQTEMDCEFGSITTTIGSGEIKLRKPLVIGQTYYIRALTDGTSGTANFNLCVMSPDVTPGATPNACNAATSVTINTANTNTSAWVPLYTADGKLMAEINANGNSLGLVSGSVYVKSGSVRLNGSGIYYMNRNITLTPATQPTTNVSVRLYFLNSELASLTAQPGSNVTGLNDINVTKNSDACVSAAAAAGTLFVPTARNTYGANADYVEISIPAFSSFYLHGGNAPLPVTLTTFNANRNGTVNSLNWSTSQEINTSLFIVERSTDGRNFTPIGQVASAGNSASLRNYQFTDAAPAKAINYYRLRIVDRDNNIKFSDVRSVKNSGNADFTIYPNPVKDLVKIDINADRNDKGVMIITDINGKQVYSRQVNVAAGNNTFSIDVSNMANGAYIIKVQLTDDLAVKKFTKL